MTGSLRLTLAATVAAVALLGIGGWVIASREAGDPLAKCRKTNVAGGLESFGGPFTLTSETGARVTDRDIFDKPALLYFGYTFCPDICPIDAARNALATDELKAKGYDLRPVFISVDPARDTAEVLRDFTDAIHPDMIGLTGSPEELSGVAKLWRNYFRIPDHAPDDQNYLVDHTAYSYLVLPKTGTAEVFNRDDSAEDMATRVACFIDAGV